MYELSNDSGGWQWQIEEADGNLWALVEVQNCEKKALHVD